MINQRPVEVLAQFLADEEDGISISAISASKLYFGVRKSGSERNLRANLEKKGVLIGPFDTQIAAHALSTGLTLVTNNLREFRQVPGLKIENWAA